MQIHLTEITNLFIKASLVVTHPLFMASFCALTYWSCFRFRKTAVVLIWLSSISNLMNFILRNYFATIDSNLTSSPSTFSYYMDIPNNHIQLMVVSILTILKYPRLPRRMFFLSCFLILFMLFVTYFLKHHTLSNISAGMIAGMSIVYLFYSIAQNLFTFTPLDREVKIFNQQYWLISAMMMLWAGLSDRGSFSAIPQLYWISCGFLIGLGFSREKISQLILRADLQHSLGNSLFKLGIIAVYYATVSYFHPQNIGLMFACAIAQPLTYIWLLRRIP